MAHTYALRAEAAVDVQRFLEAATTASIPIAWYRIETGDDGMSMYCEFTTAADLDTVLGLIDTVVDGHVMRRTVHEGSVADSDMGDLRP